MKPDMTNFRVTCTVCRTFTHCIPVPPDAYVCPSCWEKREARIKKTQAPQTDAGKKTCRYCGGPDDHGDDCRYHIGDLSEHAQR